MADWQFHYMTNVMSLTLQSSTFLFYLVAYHFHLLIVCISPAASIHKSMFWLWGLFKTRHTTVKKVDVARLSWISFTVIISQILITLFAITNYHIPLWWMICFIQFLRLSFPYWLWQWVILYSQFRLRAYGGCDRWAEDAYSSEVPDPTLSIVGGLCCPTLDFVIAFLIMITFHTLFIFAILHFKCPIITFLPKYVL
jgi:hypothetical protein